MLNSTQKDLYEMVLDKSAEWADRFGLSPEQAFEVMQEVLSSIGRARAGESILTIADEVLSGLPQPALPPAEQIFVMTIFQMAVDTGRIAGLSAHRAGYLFALAAQAFNAITPEKPACDALRAIGVEVYDTNKPETIPNDLLVQLGLALPKGERS